MILMECRNIKKNFGEMQVLKDANISISSHDRIGIVGKNGAGKTTLIDIIYGSLSADSGTIVKISEKFSIGYMKQESLFAPASIDDMSKELLRVTGELGLKKVQNFEDERLKGLSGGENAKLALANVLSQKPKLVILDEPTNHMDFKGIKWLIDTIKNYDGAFVIISHDRYFLDASVNRIVEISNGVTEEYPGNYSYYKGEKKRRYDEALKDYILQKKTEEGIQEDIDVLKNWSDKAHRDSRKKALESGAKMGVKEYYRKKAKKKDTQIKSKIKRLEKLKTEGVTKPIEEKKVFFSFENVDKHGTRMLEARDIKKSFGKRLLFEDSSFNIKYGEKVGIVGPNGCGKTTFIRMLLQTEALDSGEIWVSPSSKLAYLSQSVSDMNPEDTVSKVLDIDSFLYNELERNLLINMGLQKDILVKPIKFLSPGEKTKVKLASLILKRNNLLILDEPHNHLDLMSREQLEETLSGYTGTILLVSHDRYMLRRLCSSLLVFNGNKIEKLDCSIDDYINETSKTSQRKLKDRLIVIENRISCIVGDLSTIDKSSPQYAKLDEEFRKLVKERKELRSIVTTS